MRYRFIGAEKANYPIRILCRAMQVSTSGYYAFDQRDPSARALANGKLLVVIKEIHQESRGTYGSPRIHRELAGRGHRASPGRVERLMRAHGVTARRKRRFKVTTDSNHDMPVAGNTIERQFSVDSPDRKWAGDIDLCLDARGVALPGRDPGSVFAAGDWMGDGPSNRSLAGTGRAGDGDRRA